MISCASDQIHEHTRRYFIAKLSHIIVDITTQFLTKKECANHENIGVPGKTDIRQQPERDNKKHRDMNGQYPLQPKFLYMYAPVPERNIE